VGASGDRLYHWHAVQVRPGLTPESFAVVPTGLVLPGGGPAEASTDFPFSLHFDFTIYDITGTKNGPADASKKLLRISPDARAGSEGMLVRGLMDRVDVEPTEFSQRGCTHSAA
jgi:hypothetical protein